ncbi:MAG: hypothetical protein ACT443_00210 [Gemmatimonadota bacterium]
MRFRILFCAAALFAACGQPRQPSAPATPDPADVRLLTDLYTERLRLGLGSPYRLIEYALRDERLADQRAIVARRLLERIDDGELYEISPLVFVAAGVPETSAAAQLDLIRTTVESAPDPRIGELAIALAYETAAEQGVVTSHVAARAARVAALRRDRQLTIDDGARLRSTARAYAVAPENLVLAWRRERRFAVEQPSLAPLEAGAQQEATRLALLLAGGIRVAATPVSSPLRRTLEPPAGGLDPEQARLVRAVDTRTPHSALQVALRSYGPRREQTDSRLRAPHWQEFFVRAVDEERFVAELALARRESEDEVIAADIALNAAVALRAFAQEPVVAPANASAQDLANRFGVRVRFDSKITEPERAHTLAVLTRALDDLRSVVRGIDLSGLSFEIGRIAPDAGHIAFHDPGRRVIRLDPATLAGTIAHEIAHDLDWQLARRKYKTRSSYATDYATRTGNAFSWTVNDLLRGSAAMARQQSGTAALRPAEEFAKRFDWYVSSALAARGRSNGYLSGAQNDWIAGHGAAVRPDPERTAARSFAAIVAEATRMDRAQRAAVERAIIESAPVTACEIRRHSPFRSPALMFEACDSQH